MPTIDGMAAAQTLRTYAPLQHYGACLYYLWLSYAAHGATSAHTYQTAYQAWQATTRRHTDHNPPAGVPVWLGRRNDGDMAGDVVISLGGGRVIGTDQPTWGLVGETTIAGRMLLTRRVYLGWSEDFLGNLIALPSAADSSETPIPAMPEEEDDEVKNSGFYYTRASDGAIVYLIVNTGSGFVSEYTAGGRGNPMAGAYNNAVAVAFGTGSYASITEGHANAIKSSVVAVRK